MVALSEGIALGVGDGRDDGSDDMVGRDEIEGFRDGYADGDADGYADGGGDTVGETDDGSGDGCGDMVSFCPQVDLAAISSRQRIIKIFMMIWRLVQQLASSSLRDFTYDISKQKYNIKKAEMYFEEARRQLLAGTEASAPHLCNGSL